MRRIIIVGSALALSTPTAAQTSDTTCSEIGQFTNCHTTTQPQSRVPDYLSAMHVLPDPSGSYMQGRQEAERLRQQQLQNQLMQQQLDEQRSLSADARAREQAEAERAAQSIRASSSLAATRQQVIKLVMAGDCAGAINLALLAEDLDFATKTKAFCASGDAPKSKH